MLTIKFIPTALPTGNETSLSLSGIGTTLITVDSVEYDLTLIPDGTTVKHDVLKKCVRDGDDYEIHLVFKP